jgi:predicted MFS family arabinose efflux permease
VLHNLVVTAAISGPRTIEQLRQNLRAPSLTLPSDTLAKLDEIWPGPGGETPQAYAWRHAKQMLGAESFIVTGALTWGLALVAPQNSGKVIAWIGTAMYAAFAVGAPVGTAFYVVHGFFAIAVATAVVPLAVVPFILSLRAVAPLPQNQPPLATVLNAVLLPGLGLSLSSLGFGAITTFSTLLFVACGWVPVWVALTAFTTAFMVTRIALGHLPDKLGGAKVALVSVLLESAGLAVIWVAPSPGLAFIGAVLTGVGYALVYPGLGLEAVRRVPDQSRGLAMGTYTAFFDLGVGVSSPLLGLIAGHSSIGTVFLASTLVVLGAASIAARLLRNGNAHQVIWQES